MSASGPPRWTAAAGLVLALVFTAVLAFQLSSHGVLLEPGAAAPDFTAVDLATARPASLESYRGKVLLLNVWATWCHPCRLEMPSMERLHRRLAGTDFRIVAVSIDRDGAAVVRAFVRELGLTFDVLHDRAATIERLYQTTGVPESFVIDRHGVIVQRIIGGTDWDTPATDALVRRLLDAH
jgi:peroxiredoxin